MGRINLILGHFLQEKVSENKFQLWSFYFYFLNFDHTTRLGLVFLTGIAAFSSNMIKWQISLQGRFVGCETMFQEQFYNQILLQTRIWSTSGFIVYWAPKNKRQLNKDPENRVILTFFCKIIQWDFYKILWSAASTSELNTSLYSVWNQPVLKCCVNQRAGHLALFCGTSPRVHKVLRPPAS